MIKHLYLHVNNVFTTIVTLQAKFGKEGIRMTFKEALVTEVNSGMLTLSNHNTDNGFLSPKSYITEGELKKSGYEPMGICFNIPFNPHPSKQIAFVYLVDGEPVWCHMPQTCWYNFLYDLYGAEKVEELIEKK